MLNFALLGHPLGHSLSVQVHTLLGAFSGQELQYRLRDIPPKALSADIGELLALDGFNITTPYKQDIIPFLKELDASAQRYGAVNVVACKNGEGVGYNTDCTGFVRSLGERLCGLPCVFVIGAGGAARVCAVECAAAGAAVTIGVRQSSLARANTLAHELSSRFSVPARAITLPQAEREGSSYSLLANASPCGMYPHAEECPVSQAFIERCDSVFDCVYNPVETMLVKTAQRLAKHAVGGLPMLVWQAAAAQEIWCGSRFSPEQIQDVIKKTAALL